MIWKLAQKNKAFTLVETVVTIAIFTILAMGVTTLFTHIFVDSRNKNLTLDDLDRTRLIANTFTNEIRIASVGNDGAYPITQADDTEIIFYSNYKQADGIIARFHYYLSDQTLYKGVTLPAGDPLTYQGASESIGSVQENIATTSLPIFFYYDGDYTGSSTPLVQPVNINDIKYVRIDIMGVSAGSSIRNLKENLGN